MLKGKVIVCVSASYNTGEKLLDEVKKYSSSKDDCFAYWEEFAFTTELLPECDAIVVFNTPNENINIKADPEKVIAFMMEPGDKNLHPWMFKGLHQYSRVYSPAKNSTNTIISHGFLGWYLQQDYNYLKDLSVPEKTKAISCIASGLRRLRGHRTRLNFVNTLKDTFPQIDFFGKDEHYLPGKIDGLLPYRYSIAIENTAADNYFTEKINDCFLAYTVPVYYGCKNIGKYFPERSFITIDIEDPSRAIKKIAEVISQDDWQSRLPYITEARQLVLNKYQPLAGAANILRQIRSSEKKSIVLKPVLPGIVEKIKKGLAKLLKN